MKQPNLLTSLVSNMMRKRQASMLTTSNQVKFIEDATHSVLGDASEKTGELLVDIFSRSD